jgi:succinate dehydrogenase / fumarate reductase flavoprotein subunit
MRKSLGEVLFKEAGILRTEDSLLKALDYVHYLYNQSVGLHCITKERDMNVELSSILEFKNSLLVAEALILSAMERKESRGVHYRSDYPAPNDAAGRDHIEVRLRGAHYLDVHYAHAKGPIWKKLFKKFNL